MFLRTRHRSELLHESNDVHLIGLLNDVMQSVGEVRKVGKKFDIVEKAKASNRRGGDLHMPYNIPGAGDLMT